jgi:hypothetical protein
MPEATTRVCSKCGIDKPLSEYSGKYRYCKPCHHHTQRSYRMKSLFNLTPEDYDTMFEHQGGACYICFRPPKKQRLNVDHDHKTGLVRGLLCFSCNLSLGRFRDDADRLERAASYLREPPATKALGEERFGRVGRTTNRRGTMPRKRKKKGTT